MLVHGRVCVQDPVFLCVIAGTSGTQCLCGSHRTTLDLDPPIPCCLRRGLSVVHLCGCQASSPAIFQGVPCLHLPSHCIAIIAWYYRCELLHLPRGMDSGPHVCEALTNEPSAISSVSLFLYSRHKELSRLREGRLRGMPPEKWPLF